jgi:osmoprotectant transport system ATP-binding protein
VGSKLVQYDTPEEILAHPADEFVEGFVGHGAVLKQLSLGRVRDVELNEAAVAHVGEDPAAAIEKARSLGREHVIVLDDQERPQRWLSLTELQKPDALRQVDRDREVEVVSLASTLNDALESMLTSSHGVVVVTGRRNRYEGVVRVETIMAAIQGLRAPSPSGDGAERTDDGS